MFRYLAAILLVVSMLTCSKQEVEPPLVFAPFLNEDLTWTDSLLLTMSVEEKIGQLLIYQPDLKDSLQQAALVNAVTNNQLGGMLLNDLTLDKYLVLVDRLQNLSRIPLFNATTEHVSINNQFSDFTNLPSAATLSANEADSMHNLIDEALLGQLGNLGFNLSFALNVNANDGTESNFDFDAYDSQVEKIEARSAKMLKAIQSKNILSFSYTFNEYFDLSHDTVPGLDSLLLHHYHVVQQGVSGMVVAPEIFKIDTLRNLPPHFLKRYLKEHIEFDGILSAEWKDESFEDLAFAGIDLFVVKDSFESRFKKIKDLVDREVFTMTDLNQKVQKVLLAKSWLYLDCEKPTLDWKQARTIMAAGFDDYEIRRMFEAGLTLVQNPDNLLPFTDTYRQPFRLVRVGDENLEEFQKYFSKYASFSQSQIKSDSTGVLESLDFNRFKRNKLILAISDFELDAKKNQAFIKSVNDLGANTQVAIINFGNPKNLIHFDTTMALIQQYEQNELTESFAAQLLFGGLQAKGTLPIALDDRFPYRHGIGTSDVIRLKYTVPEEVGIAAYKLVGIDAIARSAIREKATPGCQVLVAKDGKVIYSKSFGTHDFENGRLIQQSDLFDLASITKVASTTLGMMKLYDDGQYKLNQPLRKFLDLGKKSKLKNIKIRDLLMHQSRLQANMPIAQYILDVDTSGTGRTDFFSKTADAEYSLAIADSFYMNQKYQDSIWQDVYDLKLRKRKRYRYSDVNFNLLMKVLESKTGKRLDLYNKKAFYEPLNLNQLTYNPLQRFKKRNIVPTTKEERFRNQVVHGYVHDESAALLGGVAGNAGLFGNAESLAPLFQMLLNKGEYGGKRYLSEKTVALFTKQQRGSKRGLGFDVKTKAGTNACSPQASDKTFGHTGFTGSCVWVDPETELVYIFLSNRIHPDVKNRKLFKKKVRSRIHSLVYDALNSYPENAKTKEEKEPVAHATVQ